MAQSDLVMHALEPRHLAGGMALSLAANWNQVNEDWAYFLRHGEGWGYSAANGELVATTMIVPFAGRFDWLSVVLVAPSARRLGLARRLTDHALAQLSARNRMVLLDATPAGRELYLQQGFRDVAQLERWVLKVRGAPASSARSSSPRAPDPQVRATAVADPQSHATVVADPQVRAITAADWPAILDFDARIFGARRDTLLAALRARSSHAALLIENNGELGGFLFGRNGRLFTQLGPLIAVTEALACRLLAQALRDIATRVCIDAPIIHLNLRAWLSEQGFIPSRPFARMIRGPVPLPHDLAQLFASSGPEFG